MVIFDTFLQHRKTFQKRPVFYHFSKRKLSRLSSRVVAILSMAKLVDPFGVYHEAQQDHQSALKECTSGILLGHFSGHNILPFLFYSLSKFFSFLASEVKFEGMEATEALCVHFVHYVNFFSDFNAYFFRSQNCLDFLKKQTLQ